MVDDWDIGVGGGVCYIYVYEVSGWVCIVFVIIFV